MSLTSVNIGLRELLRDPKKRQDFFQALVRDEIASQIRALRKKRGLNQSQLAEQTGMKQSAISRIEQAEYSSWTFTTLMRVAAALDGRWRVELGPAEEAVKEFEALEEETQHTLVHAEPEADAADAIAAANSVFGFGRNIN